MERLNNIQEAAAWAIVSKDIDARAKLSRACADGEMLAANEETGAKTWAVTIGGTKIATASVAEKAGKWEIDDEDAWLEFAMEHPGMVETEVFVDPQMLDKVEDILTAAGLGDALVYRSKPAEGWEAGIIEVAGRPVYQTTGETIPGMWKGQPKKYTTIRPEKGMSLDSLAGIFAALGDTRPLGMLLGGAE